MADPTMEASRRRMKATCFSILLLLLLLQNLLQPFRPKKKRLSQLYFDTFVYGLNRTRQIRTIVDTWSVTSSFTCEIVRVRRMDASLGVMLFAVQRLLSNYGHYVLSVVSDVPRGR